MLASEAICQISFSRSEERGTGRVRCGTDGRATLLTSATRCRGCRQTYLAFEQAALHPPSLARLAPPQQRCQYSGLRKVAREDVGDGDADLDGPAVPLARDVHEARLGLDHDVVPRVLGVRARGAVSCRYELALVPTRRAAAVRAADRESVLNKLTRNGTVDQLRVEGRDCLVV